MLILWNFRPTSFENSKLFFFYRMLPSVRGKAIQISEPKHLKLRGKMNSKWSYNNIVSQGDNDPGTQSKALHSPEAESQDMMKNLLFLRRSKRIVKVCPALNKTLLTPLSRTLLTSIVSRLPWPLDSTEWPPASGVGLLHGVAQWGHSVGLLHGVTP